MQTQVEEFTKKELIKDHLVTEILPGTLLLIAILVLFAIIGKTRAHYDKKGDFVTYTSDGHELFGKIIQAGLLVGLILVGLAMFFSMIDNTIKVMNL
jgi:hypothetical protein